MNIFLCLRLRNLAIAADKTGNGNTAALITEALEELEKQDEQIRNLRSALEKTAPGAQLHPIATGLALQN